MKHDPIGKQQFENQMCSQQGKVFVRHSYFSHVTNFMSKLLAPTRHNLWPFGNIYNVKIILLQKKSICNLFTRLFPSEQARVICGTKGQEGQVINAGNIDNRETFINGISIVILNSKHSAEKKIYPDGPWILMLPQGVIFQSKDIMVHTAVLENILLSLAV